MVSKDRISLSLQRKQHRHLEAILIVALLIVQTHRKHRRLATRRKLRGAPFKQQTVRLMPTQHNAGLCPLMEAPIVLW